MVSIILCILSATKFYFNPLSYLIGFIVVAFSILGYLSVEKYYDRFYGKEKKFCGKQNFGSRTKKKRKYS